MPAARLLATYPAGLAMAIGAHFLLFSHLGAALEEETATDDLAMLQLQTEKTLHHGSVEEDSFDEEADIYSAMQTEVGLLHGNRHVGTGQRFNAELEEEAFDGASFMQSESTFISKDAGRNCAFGKEKATEDEGDVVSLLQTEAVLPQRRERDDESDESEDDETALFQTTITLGKGARRVGRMDLQDDEEDDEDGIHDGTAFLQANVGLEQGGHGSTEGLNLKSVKICRRAELEEDEEENDEVSL